MDDARLTLLHIADHLDFEITHMSDEQLEQQTFCFSPELSLEEKRQPGYFFRAYCLHWNHEQEQQALAELQIFQQEKARQLAEQLAEKTRSPEWQRVAAQLDLHDQDPDSWGTLLAVACAYDSVYVGRSDEKTPQHPVAEDGSPGVAEMRQPGQLLRNLYPHWNQQQIALALQILEQHTAAFQQRRRLRQLLLSD